MNLTSRDVRAAESEEAGLASRLGKHSEPQKEGQVTVYISGYEEVLPDFQKEYPEIKVSTVTGRGSQISQRLLAERRAENILPMWSVPAV